MKTIDDDKAVLIDFEKENALKKAKGLVTLRHFPICRQEMKILDLDNLLICRHKMNNFTKFSFYACNIELDAYGRIY